MNKIIIIGRMTRDPEYKITPSGAELCKICVAVDRKYKDKEGNRQADFFNVVIWNKLAEIVAKYTKKGLQVAVEGSLEINSYEKEGKKIYYSEIVANDVRFLERVESL